MVAPTGLRGTVTAGRRLAALAAFALIVASIVVLVVYLFRNPLVVLLSVLVAELVLVPGIWIALTNRGTWRWLAAGICLVAFVALVALLLAHTFLPLLVVVLVLDLAAAAAGRYALHADRAGSRRPPAQVVQLPLHAVIFMNPRSGGGKVERFGLVEAARNAGAEVVLIEGGIDLHSAALDAVESGADCLGAAGGDGTQAIVAQVAAEHDLPFVCIPAGTRNHLALDLGLDRDDPRLAMSALTDGVAARMDLARVGEQVFVNNVSLGVYAKVVQEDEYRDSKVATFAATLPDLLGPDAGPFDLQCEAPSGEDLDGAQLVLVSNNPYRFQGLTAFGTRERLDRGVLGIVVVRIADASAARHLVRLSAAGRVEDFPDWHAWSASTFEVRSHAGTVEAGIDGEAAVLESPVRFQTMPGALRVLLPRDRPGPPEPSPSVRLRSLPMLVSILLGKDAATADSADSDPDALRSGLGA